MAKYQSAVVRWVASALLAGAMWAGLAATSASALPVGQISEFSSGLSAASRPIGIAPGPDGDLWFTDMADGAIGRITPAGLIRTFSAGLRPANMPDSIVMGADGNL